MPDLTSRLIVELIDRVSGPATKASKSLRGVADASKLKGFGKGAEEINRLTNALKKAEVEAKKLSNFRVAFKGFQEARSNFRRAQEDVRRLAKELQVARKAGENFGGGAKGIRDLERRLNTARNSVHRFARDFKTQSEIVKTAARSIGGVSFGGLQAKEANLKRFIDQTNASLREQVKLTGETGKRGSSQGGGRRGGDNSSAPSGSGSKRWRDTGITLRDGARGAAGAMGFAGFWQSLADSVSYGYSYQKEVNRQRAQGGASAAAVLRNAAYADQFAQGGLISRKGAMEVMTEANKAGLDEKAARALLKPGAYLSSYAGVEPLEAANYLIPSVTQYGLPAASEEEATKSYTRMADLLAYASANTQGDVSDYAAASKYAAPFASMLGLEPEQMMAMAMAMNRRGHRGDEIGTALRSMFVTSVKPTLGGVAAMSELGLSFGDYATKVRPFTADEFLAGAETKFGKVGDAGRGAIAKVIADNPDTISDELAGKLATALIEATGSKGAQDRAAAAKYTSQFLGSQADEIDFDSLLADLQDKNVTPGQLARIFNAKHGSRITALMEDGVYQDYLQQLTTKAPGSAERQAGISQEGTVGLVNRAWSVGESQVLQFWKDIESFKEDVLTVGEAVTWATTGKTGPRAGRAATSQEVRDTYGPQQPPALTKGNFGGPGFRGTIGIDGTDKSLQDTNQIKGALDELNGTRATPVVSISGVQEALRMIETLRASLATLNTSSSASVRGLHADTGGGGW